MSFSNRLTTFFALMVLVPILAIGVLGFRLIDQTTSARAEARASGLMTADSGVYTSDEQAARSAAQAVAVSIARLSNAQVRTRIPSVATDAGMVRVLVKRNGRTVADDGSSSAVAPGSVDVHLGQTTTSVTVSVTTAVQFTRAVSGPLSATLVSQGGRVLASTLGAKLAHVPPPTRVTIDRVTYETDTFARLAGFAGPVTLTALSDTRASSSSGSGDELMAIAFVGGLALLAFGFAVLASRGLNEMVKRFLAAATRLADRDFSARVPIEGKDEFARLGSEFNRMSDQLEGYIAQLDAERKRLREAIRRTGETFASGRDKAQLETITLETAISGIDGDFGRMTWRDDEDRALEVVQSTGDLTQAGTLIHAAEQMAIDDHGFGQADDGDLHIMAARMGVTPQRQLAYGTLAIGRHGRPFDEEDLDLFRSLAAQAWRALDNVRLHDEAERKAVTDLLTGLANYGQFQAVLSDELEGARRYDYPVGLILFDLDDFKRINDTYGHLQGDAVLRAVARVLRHETREGDTAARYGGEELALILPHTDLDGSFAIAERIRDEIAEMTVALLDGNGELHVTASVGVSTSSGSAKELLIADADAALYSAKRIGKNRTLRSDDPEASIGSFTAEKTGSSG